MSPYVAHAEQHEIFVLMEPEEFERLGLLPRQRSRTLAVPIASAAVLVIAAALWIVARPGPSIADYAAAVRGERAVRTARDATPALVPAAVTVQPSPVTTRAPRQDDRAAQPLPAPAPPAAALTRAPSPEPRAVAAAPATDTAADPEPVLTELLGERPTDGPWVIKLRNGNVFVVDHAKVTDDWVTLWVQNGVVDLPMDDLREHGRRQN